MDTKMQVVGEALKTLKTIDAAGGLAVDLQRLLGSVRKERERVVVEQAEAEELTKLLKSEVAKAIEERQRAAEQVRRCHLGPVLRLLSICAPKILK
jgi:predicted transcriptional regulator